MGGGAGVLGVPVRQCPVEPCIRMSDATGKPAAKRRDRASHTPGQSKTTERLVPVVRANSNLDEPCGDLAWMLCGAELPNFPAREPRPTVRRPSEWPVRVVHFDLSQSVWESATLF